MTAITLNLLAEEQQAQQAQARDPFKIAVAVGVGLVAVVALTGAVMTTWSTRRASELSQLQSKLDAIKTRQTSADGVEVETIKVLSKDFIEIHRQRRLMAPQLAMIKDAIPDIIQLSRINLQVQTETQETMPSAEVGEEGKAKVRRSKGKQIDRMILRIEGKATCARPEIEVDEFLRSLKLDPSLGPLLEQVKLKSIARAGGGFGTGSTAEIPVANFVIECRYKEKP